MVLKISIELLRMQLGIAYQFGFIPVYWDAYSEIFRVTRKFRKILQCKLFYYLYAVIVLLELVLFSYESMHLVKEYLPLHLLRTIFLAIHVGGVMVTYSGNQYSTELCQLYSGVLNFLKDKSHNVLKQYLRGNNKNNSLLSLALIVDVMDFSGNLFIYLILLLICFMFPCHTFTSKLAKLFFKTQVCYRIVFQVIGIFVELALVIPCTLLGGGQSVLLGETVNEINRYIASLK